MEVRKDIPLLRSKVFEDLFFIVGKEVFENRTIAFASMLRHTGEVFFYVGQTLVDVVLMRGHEVRHQMFERGLVEAIAVGVVVVEGVNIEDEEHKIHRHLISVANLLDTLFAKAQRYAQTRHDKDEIVVGGNDVGHLHPTSKKNIFHVANIHKKNGLANPWAKIFCQRAGPGLRKRGLAGLYR